MSTFPEPPNPPDWEHCGRNATTTDPVGCRGIHVPGHTACLAHLTDPDRDAYLAGLAPGTNIDHRGTPFTENLLDALLQALRDPGTGRPRLGDARFDDATFSDVAGFGRAMFTGDAWFDRATFSGLAWFKDATFSGDARFSGAMFSGDARFSWATFTGDAGFGGATFTGDAGFGGATFTGLAWFNAATFTDVAGFDRTTFSGNARFEGATFSGNARFEAATFTDVAWFGGVTFLDAQFGGATFTDAQFDGATFTEVAWFDRATFSGNARFDRATSIGLAWFNAATFTGDAGFSWATFSGDAEFDRATFSGNAGFQGATFSGDARFAGATFTTNAHFGQARFAIASSFGPLACVRQVDLSGAVFEAPVTIEIAASVVRCVRTRWNATATFCLRYAIVDLSDAVLSSPVAVTARSAPFSSLVDESVLIPLDPGVQLASLEGVDATHLVLSDLDLTHCLFSGAFHLDQLRLEGNCTFASVPAGRPLWRFKLPSRWTRRRTLAEEHHWRAAPRKGKSHPPRGWNPGSSDRVPRPADVAAIYRQLRKAFEDGKNEPGAADFYYGEMEMRCHDKTETTAVERGLIRAYWLLSGYGLRASRALLWLGLSMTGTVLAMMLWGLPKAVVLPSATGTTTGTTPGIISLKTDKPDLSLPGERITLQRADRAIRVSVNAVVFRTSGQNLTRAGNYIEMVSRIIEPILLALAVLAVRARVKR
ncbi:pentapeptide repeat-containing protein [Kitasatospora sp. NPDC085895]|uniref:pentapeptide repeat-containing protein n=1 Tax=Kitasatospora sp. NPDC085895 TaxID=3155057 RepID=UPI00344D11F1